MILVLGKQLVDMILLTNILCFHIGTFGLVDYTNYEDMKYAVRIQNSVFFVGPTIYIVLDDYLGQY